MALQPNLANVLYMLEQGFVEQAAHLTCAAPVEVAVDIALNVALRVTPHTLRQYHDAIRQYALSG